MAPREPKSPNDDVARLLRLLRADPTGAVAIAAMHEDGIRAPAQAVYALRLAGYDIDRVFDEHAEGLRMPAYRLRPEPDPAPPERTTRTPSR